MTDEPIVAPVPVVPEPPVTDRWQLWFFRLVQATGWAGIIYEAVFKNADRPWLLLWFGAMILGARGLDLIARVVARKVTG